MDKATEFCNYSDLLSSVKSLEYGDVLLILGDNHMGKTWFRNKMCATHSCVFSLSFKGYDVNLIPNLINAECETWNDLLSWIGCQEGFEYLVIDDADYGKNADSFWDVLIEQDKDSINLKIVLLAAVDPTPETLECYTSRLSLMSLRRLSDHLDLTGKEIKELLCMTGGYPEIMAEFSWHGSFEEKLRGLLTPTSAFWTLAPKIMERLFASVETYNTILYAMTQGNKALTTIAKASGMKDNACLEYLKKLLAKGLIRLKESQNGHKEYFIVNSYIYLWYAFVYTARLNADFAFSDQTIIVFDEILRKEVYRRFLRDSALKYLHSTQNPWHFDITNDELHQDVTVDYVNFDYVGEDKYLQRTVLFKCGLLTTRVVKKALRAMKQTPFHEKEYVFQFTNKSIPRECWTIAKTYDNVHIVQEKSLYRMHDVPCE